MLIFKSSNELYSHFFRDILSELPTRVFIATYGLWGGVKANGGFVPKCNSYRLLDYLDSNTEKCKTTILVGYDNFVSETLIETANRFEGIDFIALRDFHSKCILTSTGILSIGSSNLNDSGWWELNLYNKVEVGDSDYMDIHRNLELLAWSGDKITRSMYPKIDISNLIPTVTK